MSQNQDITLEGKKYMYMMATKANHIMDDLGRKEPDLCIVYGQNENNYIGQWVTGFGFIDVEFSKETTRELTEAEREHYSKLSVKINDRQIPQPSIS